MAVGYLWGIWLDVPEDLEDKETLAGAFENFFGVKWEEATVGSDKPFVYHRDWEGYFAVTGLKPEKKDLLVPQLTGNEAVRAYNVLVGS